MEHTVLHRRKGVLGPSDRQGRGWERDTEHSPAQATTPQGLEEWVCSDLGLEALAQGECVGT